MKLEDAIGYITEPSGTPFFTDGWANKEEKKLGFVIPPQIT